MLPIDLKVEQFNAYPPEARKLVTNYLTTLRQLPLGFLPSLLREAIDYDFRFPAERSSLDKELAAIAALSPQQRDAWFSGFSKIKISPALESVDWVNSPAQFVEQLSAHLWTTHQLDAFRIAATEYADRLHAAVPPELPAIPRLGITVVGQGVVNYEESIFRKLRPHGVYYSAVKPESGLNYLLEALAARAKKNPAPFSHWYVDGGQEAIHDSQLTSVSYGALEPARLALSEKMRAEIERPGMGPETLRTLLAQMRPADLGLDRPDDPVLDRFRVRLLTEGSGTQVFSTTFAQWTAREALRRAQPLSMLVRFAPRQRQKPMNELIYGKQEHLELDYVGSLIDGDMGAYYNWLNQQRLSGAEQSSFLAWFENHNQAVAIGPSMSPGTTSAKPIDLKELVSTLS
jgi:hypothetical protein